MSTNEILSLQFGHYSNFVGAHWWNIQESGFKYDPNSPSEIDHEVLYREGVTLNGDLTFTPRLLLVDLNGALKALPEQGDLYSLPQDSNDPVNCLEVQANEKENKTSFQQDLDEFGTVQVTKKYNLDNEVRVWSDFLYTRFHPRTINILKYYHHSTDHSLFDIYPLGVNMWKNHQFSEDFIDKIRNYVEECNNFQGFHALLDSTDGFAGLASSCLEYVRDEYNSKSVLAFPLDINYARKTPIQLLNLALCFEALAEHSSLFVPMSSPSENFDFLSYKRELPYHTSAILASALDTVTLNYRLKSSKQSLIDICSDFSNFGRKAAAASVCFPFPLKKNEDFIDCLNDWSGPLVHSLHPDCELSFDKSLQMIALRGIPETRLKRPPHIATNQRDLPAYRCNNVKDMLDFYMACNSYNSKTEVTVSTEPMSVVTPFPKIFNRIHANGDVDLSLSNTDDVSKVNVLAGFHSGKYIGNVFAVLSNDLEKIKYKQFHQFSSEGIENDQFKECLEQILNLRDCYVGSELI